MVKLANFEKINWHCLISDIVCNTCLRVVLVFKDGTSILARRANNL